MLFRTAQVSYWVNRQPELHWLCQVRSFSNTDAIEYIKMHVKQAAMFLKNNKFYVIGLKHSAQSGLKPEIHAIVNGCTGLHLPQQAHTVQTPCIMSIASCDFGKHSHSAYEEEMCIRGLTVISATTEGLSGKTRQDLTDYSKAS